jgi:hypothetical protein
MSFVFDAKLEKLLRLNGFTGDVYGKMGFLWSSDIDCWGRGDSEKCGFARAVCDRLVLLQEFVAAWCVRHPEGRRRPAKTDWRELVVGGVGRLLCRLREVNESDTHV